VVAPLAVKVVEVPGQMGFADAEMLTVGPGFTVIRTEAVLVHPVASVPVTIYVVVVSGLAVTVAPVVADKPVAGDHEYETTPLAVNVTELPEHIIDVVGKTDTVAEAFDVTVTDAVDVLHPLASATVTVYVPAHKLLAVAVV
jgi:hypothetical protein